MSDNPAADRIKSEIDSNSVVLFMKGNPMFPQCGFSAAVVQALTMMEVKFKGVDVLADDESRQGFVQVPAEYDHRELFTRRVFIQCFHLGF